MKYRAWLGICVGLAALSAGGCTLDAVEAVCGAELEPLAALLDNSLLRRERRPGGEPRFRMLETVREFALERLGEAGEGQNTLMRHARWVRDLLGAAQGPIMRHAESPAWQQRLALEEGNARAALRFELVEKRGSVANAGCFSTLAQNAAHSRSFCRPSITVLPSPAGKGPYG